MAGQTADAVVIGAGPNGLVAANALADAGWDVVVLEAQRRGRRCRAQRRGHRPGLRQRPVQRVLPPGRGLPGDPRPRPRRPRPGVGAGPERPRARPGRRPGRGPAPATPRGRRRASTRSPTATARPGWPCSSSGTGSATPCWTRCSPRSPRSPRPCGCCAGSAPPAPSTSPGWPSRPCAGSARSGSGVGAALLLAGNAMHATSRPTRPAAACSAGCWRCWARTSASPCPRGGAQQLASSLQRRTSPAAARSAPARA